MKFHIQALKCVVLLISNSASAFLLQTQCNKASHCLVDRSNLKLYGISEWRDAYDDASIITTASSTVVDDSDNRFISASSLAFSTMDDDDEDTNYQQNAALSPRSLSMLLRDAEEVTLLGEEKHFQFATKEEVHVIRKAIDENEGIFGVGLVRKDSDDDENDELLDVLPLFEIQNHVHLGDFGIMCKAVNVGRAIIHDFEPTSDDHDNKESNTCFTASCHEKFDKNPKNIILSNNIANVIENLVSDISDIEESLLRKSKEESYDNAKTESISSDSELTITTTRFQRFQQAYESAMFADPHGYVSSSSITTTNNSKNNDDDDDDDDNDETSSHRSWKELSAISWAAFASSDDLRKDSHFRIKALDMNSIESRLKLAMYWLGDVLMELEEEGKEIQYG